MFKCTKCEGESVSVRFQELNSKLKMKDIAKIKKYDGYVDDKGIVIKEFLLCTCQTCGYTYVSDVAKNGDENPFNIDEEKIKEVYEELTNSINKDYDKIKNSAKSDLKKIGLNAAEGLDLLNIKFKKMLRDL